MGSGDYIDIPERTSADDNSSTDFNQAEANDKDRPIGITIRGVAQVGSNQISFRLPWDGTIINIEFKSGDTPTGADLQSDFNKNGTSIFTNQSNRPIITAGNNTGTSGIPDIADGIEGDIYSIDIDQVGSGVPGGNELYWTIYIRRTG